MQFALTTKEQLQAHMWELPAPLPCRSPVYFVLNRKLLTVFLGNFRIPYLQAKPQLLFQTIILFPAAPIVAKYECCKRDRNQIPNYSGMIQNRAAIVKTAKLTTYCNAMLESWNPKQWGEDSWNSMGAYLAQAAKSVSLNNAVLASVEQERRLHFNLLPEH